MLKYRESGGVFDAFSRNHTLPYSTIALQEMNLCYHYPPVYWQCAVLTVNAQATEEDNAKSTNYGKIATAISNIQGQGVKVALPEVNSASFGFRPDASNNRIVFGLKAINAIGDDIVTQIIANRPYESLLDFCEKNANLGAKTVIYLIKAGSFDSVENRPRFDIMEDYVRWKVAHDIQPKTSLDMKNFASAVTLGILPSQFNFQYRINQFRAYIFDRSFQVDNALLSAYKLPKNNLFALDASANVFFENELIRFFKEGLPSDKGAMFTYIGDQTVVYKNKFEKWYKEQIEGMGQWLSSPQTLEIFNKAAADQAASEIRDKYCLGTIPDWEMDSLSFYYTAHALAHINASDYGVTQFSDIPEDPVVIGSNTKKVRNLATGEIKETVWDKFELYRICGTVLDKNKNKHSITLLTTDGVVTVKFYAGAFTNYDKQISEKDAASGKKSLIEKSWFTRGNKLLLTGIRRGETFFPKTYFDSIYKHSVCLITDVLPGGSLELQYERTESQDVI